MKHKQWSLMLGIALSMFGIQAVAYDACIDGIYYNFSDTEAKVTYLSSSTSANDTAYSGSVVIPETVIYNGTTYPVSSIEQNAFAGCSSLVSVTIPSSITSISSGNPFKSCINLTSIVVDEGNSKYDSRNGCNAIIETARNSLIVGCKNTTIPNTVSEIKYWAFYGCRGLTSITLPVDVTSIGDGAFYGCHGLTSFTIPASVENVGSGALADCILLKKLNVNCRIVPDLFRGNNTRWFPALEEITFGSNVKEISCSWNYIVSSKTKVSYASIKQVCEMKYGSSYCNPLNFAKSFYIGGNIITDVTITSDVDSISNYAFIECSSITSISIPDKVKSIGTSAFLGCDGLTSLHLGNGVESIGKYAFYNCRSLSSLSIPNSVTKIDDWAFCGCCGLSSSLSIPNSVATIGENAFNACTNLTSLSIPNSVTSIGRCAFLNCSNLSSITIGDGLTKISEYCFSGCNGLSSIIIGKSVTSIDNQAFYGCGNLSAVTLPDNVKSIGAGAFCNCQLLQSVTLPSDLGTVGRDAFKGTPWFNDFCNRHQDGLIYLGKICYQYKGEMPENAHIAIEDGTLYLADYLLSDSTKLVSIALPQSLKGIGEYAFKGCENLSSVILPPNLTNIGKSAFENCRSIPSITIPEGITEISARAFCGCSNLAEVKFPKSLLTIGSSAFEDCKSLTHVEFPKRLKTIGASAFSYCGNKGLKVVWIPSSVEYIASRAFAGVKSQNAWGDDCCGLDTIYFRSASNVNTFTGLNPSHSNYPLHQSANPIVVIPHRGVAEYNKYSNYKYFYYTDSANYIHPIDLALCNQGQGYLSIELKNTEQILGFQFDLRLPSGITVATDGGKVVATLSNRKADHVLSVSDLGDNTYRFVTVSMNNKPFSGHDGEIIKIKVFANETINLGKYGIRVNNAETTTYDADYDLIEQILSKDDNGLLTIQKPSPGDVNGDMKVSVTDVVSIIDDILNNTPSVFLREAADVNGDYNVSVTDAIIVIDMILNEGKEANVKRNMEPQ